MTTINVNKLASQIRDIFTGGSPDTQSRVTIGQIELLIKQAAPAVLMQDFKEMYREFGVHQVNDQFIKPYTISLTAGGLGWKIATLPAPYLALPTNRGVAYVLEAETMNPIEIMPKYVLANLSGGILQETGSYFACPAESYLEIRTSCNKTTPRLQSITVGLITPGENAMNEVHQLVIMEKVLAILKGQPYPDKTINANPQ